MGRGIPIRRSSVEIISSLWSCDCLGDYDRLFALLISDKLKSCLQSGAINYVLSLEGCD